MSFLDKIFLTFLLIEGPIKKVKNKKKNKMVNLK